MKTIIIESVTAKFLSDGVYVTVNEESSELLSYGLMPLVTSDKKLCEIFFIVKGMNSKDFNIVML